MRLPTTTVAGLLLATAAVAFDLAAIEPLTHGRPRPSWETGVLLAILPSLNVLLIGLYVLVRQLSLRGETSAFPVGLEAAGWPAVAVTFIAMLGFEKPTFEYTRWAEDRLGTFWWDYIEWTGEFSLDHWNWFRLGFQVFALAAPQLIVTLVGGWAAARWGVVIVKGSARAGRRRAIPIRRAIAVVPAAAVLLGTAVVAAEVKGRWFLYSEAVRTEDFFRRRHEQMLAEIRSLDQAPGEKAGDPARRARLRKSLVTNAENESPRLAWLTARRKNLELAVRRPWLRIPPDPSLNPSDGQKTK